MKLLKFLAYNIIEKKLTFYLSFYLNSPPLIDCSNNKSKQKLFHFYSYLLLIISELDELNFVIFLNNY